jgi:hypothetical protein
MASSRNRARELRPSDPDYGPSVEWGWHGGFPRGLRIAGLVSAVILTAVVLPRNRRP